jgi:O-methyltransferase involved in polyketide biosynthesis
LPWIEFTGKEGVSVCRLDDVGLPDNYNIIYMDVQGYELEVLRGASKRLRAIDAIFTEVNRDEVFEGCAKIEEIDSFLAGHGFRRVETDWHGGQFGDALYVR